METDEDVLNTVLSVGYRRTSTVIHLHAKVGSPGVTEIETIDPDKLDAALARDADAADPPIHRSEDRNSTPEA